MCLPSRVNLRCSTLYCFSKSTYSARSSKKCVEKNATLVQNNSPSKDRAAAATAACRMQTLIPLHLHRVKLSRFVQRHARRLHSTADHQPRFRRPMKVSPPQPAPLPSLTTPHLFAPLSHREFTRLSSFYSRMIDPDSEGVKI